jgi:hypothetical protein
MKKSLGILFLLFILIACGDENSIDEYANAKVIFKKSLFTASNNQFSIMLPTGWRRSESPTESDTILYSMESGPKDALGENFTYLFIGKMKFTYGTIDTEFDLSIQKIMNSTSNLRLLGKSTIKIGKRNFKTAHLAYHIDRENTQEIIEIFIPYGKNHYYIIHMFSERNEHIKGNFGILFACARSFKFK